MIGILMYTLYDQTTGKNTPKNVGMYTSGDHFQSTLIYLILLLDTPII